MDHNVHHKVHSKPLESPWEYAKFVGVIAGIAIVSVLLTTWRQWSVRQLLEDFMAIFFITFAAFKFVDLDMFARTYRSYDMVTQRFPLWGYAFPFIEAVLGFSYLLTTKNAALNLITMLITGVAGVGVWRELRLNATRRRGHIMCVCLGRIIQLPLSKVSFVEDFVMFMMALAMLFIK